MAGNIIWGLLGIILSFALVKWRRYIIDFFGRWGWAERYLGAGGSYTAIVLFAILLFIISITKMSGKLDSILNNSVGQYF